VKIFRKNIFLFVVALCLLAFSSCFSPKQPEHYVALYLESPQQDGIFGVQRTFFLPVIDKEIKTGKDPVLNIDALSDFDVCEKFDSITEQSSFGLFLKIKDDYAIKLRQISASAPGRKLILVADGQPLGFCVLKNNFTRNDLFFYIMTSSSGNETIGQMEDLCFELNGFILAYREYKEQK